MDKERQVARVVTRRSLKEKSNDLDFWLRQPAEACIAAVEQARREYHGWKLGAEPRLQRVYSIFKRK